MANDLRQEQEEAERIARDAEAEKKRTASPDYPAERAVKTERGPDPTPELPDGENVVADDDPTPGGRAPEPPKPGPDAPRSPTLQPRNTIPPRPGNDRGGGVSA